MVGGGKCTNDSDPAFDLPRDDSYRMAGGVVAVSVPGETNDVRDM